MASDKRYLHQRRRGWYVAVEVPPALREVVGKRRIVRSLQTQDLAEAQRRRWTAIKEIKDELDVARHGHTPKSLVEEALGWREDISNNPQPDIIESLAVDRAEEIKRDRGAQAAGTFYGIATGQDDPLQPIADRWLEEIKDTVTGQTVSQHRQAVSLLHAFLGEGLSVRGVTRAEAGRFISESLVASGRAPKTCNRIISSLSSFWRWMIKRGVAGENPWREQALPKRRKRVKRPFAEDELVALLSGKPTGRIAKTALPDLMRLALMTGARLDELCSLRVADVVDGCLVIHEGKTEAARRRVPVHHLIKGILDGRTEGKSRTDYLFQELSPGGPDEKRGWYISKAFTAYRRTHGVPDGETDFHSFRRSMATALERAGVAQNVAAELVGHAKSGMTFGLYSGGLAIEQLREAVDRVDHGKAVMGAVLATDRV